MHRSLAVALMASAAFATCGSAFAQSSVQVYGRMNVSMESQKDGTQAAKTVMQNNASRFGFRGTEDLGGGLTAGFVLESGFNADTGATTQSAFFGRQSEVNLSGKFGMLRMGNYTSEAYFATADYISMHNHDTGTSSDALYASAWRSANKIAYRTPSMGGATVDLGVSMAEGVANKKSNYDLAANWTGQSVHLGAGYEKDGDAHQFALRGLFFAGPVTVGAYVQRDTNMYGSGNRTNVRLSAMYELGLSEFHLNLGHAGNYSHIANSKASQATIAYNYKLSKRTKLYTFYTKVNAAEKTPYASDFSSLAVGVRHNF